LPLLPIPALKASVNASGAVALRTFAGAKVTQLDAGTYRIVVTDRNRRAGFHLGGPGLHMNTSKRFVGRRRWLVDIGTSAPYGSTFAYRADGRRRVTFIVH
jgi:hypothetical protein